MATRGEIPKERQLISASQAGSLEAFNQLVAAYQNQVYSLAYRLLGEAQAAADATQEAFISCYQHLGGFRGGSFRAFLFRIVTNACYDELRRRRRKPTVSLEDLSTSENDGADPDGLAVLSDPGETPEEASARHELRRALEDCLLQLNLEQRAVVLLADLQAMDYLEVAQSLKIALGTVKSRLARARANLRDCLLSKGELLPSEFRLEEEAAS
jgi:RNA polymerase sigma-70 factor (ECF subfamily)